MKKRSIPSLLAAVVLLLPLLGALTTATTVRTAGAAVPQGQLMTAFEMVFNTTYAGRATHYVYSSGGTIREVFDLPPAAADWATPSNFYEEGWFRNSTAEVYTYSYNGRIGQTSNPMSIPVAATWATISSFEIDGTPGQPVSNPVFRYSINGTDVLTAAAATDIPPNAQWASLASFGTAWVEISNVQYTSYSLSRPIPSVVSFSISSDGGNPPYAQPGESLTVTLVTDIPVMEPILKVAGRTLFSEGSGTRWEAGLYLFNYNVDEGPIPVSAEFYSLNGAPGPVLTATTDGTSFIHDKNPPSLSYTLSPSGPTNRDVTVEIAASDAGSGLEIVKIASGSRDASYFSAGGTAYAGSFAASENGTFTAYAKDRLGKTTVLPITIAGIDREAPTLTLTPSTTAPTNADVEVTASATDNVAIGKRLWSEGTRDAAYFRAGNGVSFADGFTVAANGTYTAYVEDTADNATLATITVSNLYRQALSIALTPFPLGLTNEPVTVGVDVHPEGEDAGNPLAALRWAKGERDAGFFAAGGGRDVLAAQEFEAEENGRYTVYARDSAGNEGVAFLDISNIDREAPTLTLTPSETRPTKGNVTVTVNAADAGSGLARVRWSATAPVPDSPWPSSEVVGDEFTVERNGTYTVVAIDRAGNKTVRQLIVANIFLEAPTLSLSPETTEPTGGKVTVSVQAAGRGAGNSLAQLLWSAGERTLAYFREGPIEEITTTKRFDATANGTYTVYARDAAGNEALETIAIDNIRRANAALSALLALNGEEELALSPAFDPERQTYSIQAGQAVSSITVQAAAADADATVSVNGAPLSPGESASIPLSFGANAIRIVVTAQLPSVRRTYTIEATRQSPPSAGPSGSSSSGGASEVPTAAFTARLNGKPAKAELNETAVRGPDGRLTKELYLKDAAAIVALARPNEENELRIESDGKPQAPTDAVKLRLSSQAMSQLSAHRIRLTLGIGEVSYEWHTGASAGTGGERVVELKALRQAKDAEKMLGVAGSASPGEFLPKLAGIPAEVSASGASEADETSWLVLPVPEGLDSAGLRKLAVLLENEDGSVSIVPGKLRYDSQGRANGIAVRPGEAARAALLLADPVKVSFESYVGGYSATGFGPDRPVTRAELAAMLAKLTPADDEVRTGDNRSPAFRDMPQGHWAAAAVARASDAGWMGGKPNGRFGPSDPLTRAELASVLARWRQEQTSGKPRFPDAASHWASAAISAAERRGWMTGYADGSFGPDRKVTRAEAVTIMNRVLARPSLPEGGRAWSDVPAAYWAAGAIRSASATFEALRYLDGGVEPIGK